MIRSLKLIRLSLALVYGVSSTHGATLTWTNLAGGAWTNSANWSPNQVPAAADQVVITNSSTYTVTLPANASVNRLTIGGSTGIQTVLQSAGTFNPGNANIQLNGRLTLQDGSLGGVLLIEPGATFAAQTNPHT